MKHPIGEFSSKNLQFWSTLVFQNECSCSGFERIEDIPTTALAVLIKPKLKMRLSWVQNFKDDVRVNLLQGSGHSLSDKIKVRMSLTMVRLWKKVHWRSFLFLKTTKLTFWLPFLMKNSTDVRIDLHSEKSSFSGNLSSIFEASSFDSEPLETVEIRASAPVTLSLRFY